MGGDAFLDTCATLPGLPASHAAASPSMPTGGKGAQTEPLPKGSMEEWPYWIAAKQTQNNGPPQRNIMEAAR